MTPADPTPTPGAEAVAELMRLHDNASAHRAIWWAARSGDSAVSKKYDMWQAAEAELQSALAAWNTRTTLTTALATAVAGEWRPIEEAPRDGSWFVIRCLDETYECGFYSPYKWANYEEVDGGLYRKVETQILDWSGFNNFHRATHWMPLAPPSARSPERGRG